MAYANRNVFKTVTSSPEAVVSIKHFDYGDMINSSVVLSKSQTSNISPRDITYIIINDDGEVTHYFATTVEFLSKNKFRLGLYRNAWVDADLSNTLGRISRGTTTPYNIANYKPNTIGVNTTKNREVYITDQFTHQTNGLITKPSSWGILYTSKLDDEAENPYIDVGVPPYVVSGTQKLESSYYRDITAVPSTQGFSYTISNIKDRLMIVLQSGVGYTNNDNKQQIYGMMRIYNDCTYSLDITPTTISLRITNIGTEILSSSILTEDSFKTGSTYRNYVTPSTLLLTSKVSTAQAQVSLQTLENFVSGIYNKPISVYINSLSNYQNDNSLVNQYGSTITANNTQYNFQSKELVNSLDGSIVDIEGEYFMTSVSYNSVAYTQQSTKDTKPIYGGNSFVDDSQSANWYLFPDYLPLNKPVVRWGSSNATYTTSLNSTYANNTMTILQDFSILTQSYTYTSLGGFRVTFDKLKLNHSMRMLEPYGIMAIPLFDIKIKQGLDYRETSGIYNQQVFYELITKYSGGSNPFIVDAQIIPYAPTIFKTNHVRGTNEYIDYTNLTDIISTATDTYLGAPCIMLESSDINVDVYINLNPYSDIQKEYTIRNYRLQSPAQDGAIDFKYYDYNRTGQPFTIGGEVVGDTLIQIDITLKPFGLYMHAKPYCRDGSLVALQEFDDMSGMICGQGVFQSSLTSSAFETYKRENSMHTQIQERKIETMNINQGAERTNEKWSVVTSTLQATAMGTLAGASMAATTPGKIAAGTVAGVAAGATVVAAGVEQYKANEELRKAEIKEANDYYNLNLQTIKNLPNTLNRVSSLNQDILNHFCIFVEVYDCTTDERQLYDTYAELLGNNLEINDNIENYLLDGKYIKATIFRSDIKQDIISAIKSDLEKGVYYNEQI